MKGTVKKCGLLKIVHEKYKQTSKTKISPEITEFRLSLEEAAASYQEITPFIGKAQVIDFDFAVNYYILLW